MPRSIPELIDQHTAFYKILLGLQDWRINTFTTKDAEEGGDTLTLGNAMIHHHSHMANITYLETQSPETLAETVAHEMTHVRLDGVDMLFRAMVEMLPESVREGMTTLYKAELEVATKALGIAFAQLHPGVEEHAVEAVDSPSEE